MVQKFEFFRLSLLPREQAELFDPNPNPSRETYLRQVFGQHLAFQYRGNEYHYVPTEGPTPAIIFGRIGRSRLTDENLPPDEGMAEARPQRWKASIIAIDPRHHGDGQKVAVQAVRVVGSAGGLLRSLVIAVNEANPLGAYDIDAKPIFDGGSFWTFVDENRGRITLVSFELVAPNMFGIEDDVDKEMQAFRDREKAKKVNLTLKNEDGHLHVETDRIRQTVEYAERGTGGIRATALGNKRYKSGTKPQSVTIDEPDEADEALLVRIGRRISELFSDD
jgi:hypothetical protein